MIVGRLIPDNNSELIINGLLSSNSIKKIIIVGDVPYNDQYAKTVKSKKSKKVVFTGYIKSQENLSELYRNCFGYIHGHEFGETNPTMINVLDLNCEIIALKTVFNVEMLKEKNVIFFEKNINSLKKSLILFEKNHENIFQKNNTYRETIKK